VTQHLPAAGTIQRIREYHEFQALSDKSISYRRTSTSLYEKILSFGHGFIENKLFSMTKSVFYHIHYTYGPLNVVSHAFRTDKELQMNSFDN
jgi:hypothetical protein